MTEFALDYYSLMRPLFHKRIRMKKRSVHHVRLFAEKNFSLTNISLDAEIKLLGYCQQFHRE